MSSSQSQISDDDIGHMQEKIIRAVLLSQPLLGGSQPIRFPDLSFVLKLPSIFLSDRNLMYQISLQEFPKPLRVFSPEAIQKEAEKAGDIAYLQFQPPKCEGNTILLTLEAKIAPKNSGQQILGLSGVQVRFQKVGDHWEVIEEPVFFAA